MPLAGNFFLYKDMDDANGSLVAGKMERKEKISAPPVGILITGMDDNKYVFA
jgi:hypothetical protein